MKIPRNFDRWMFDYKEGSLSQSEMSYFEKFMAENPQLNQDINAWDNSYIKKESIAYPGIANLEKNRRFGAIYTWAATITLLIISSISSFYFISSDTNKVYSLRDSEFGLFSTLIGTNNDFEINSSNIGQDNNINQPAISVNNSTSNSSTPGNLTTSPLISSHNSNNENSNFDDNNRGHINSDIVNDEINKIESNNSTHSTHYKNNPGFHPNKIKTTKKSKSKYGTIGYKLKKVLKRIEKMTGYPVGLTNLKDPDLLIPNNNLLDFNGGFVGGYGAPRIEAKYRNQWLGESNNLQSTFLNFDTYSKSLRGGLGVIFNSNNFNNGAFTDNRMSIFYSPKFALNSKVYFEPSIKMTLGLMTLNSSKILPNTKLEVERGRIINTFSTNDLPTANNLWYKDYGLGFVLNADKFYIGFQADNLAQHNQSVYNSSENASIKYSAIVGMDYQSRNKKTTLSPFVSYYNNNNINEFWGGVNIKYQSITLGGAYSNKNEYSASLGMKFKTFKLIYQYDRTNSYLSDVKLGSHTLGIRINAKRKKLR